MDFILTYFKFYFMVGLLWLLIHEITGWKMDNGGRLRLLLFWPVTMLAWLVGFIQAMIDSWNNPWQ